MRRAFALLGILTLACIRETPDVSQNAPSQPTTTSNPQTGTTQNTATSRVPAAAVGEERVELIEYEIRMPETLKAGKTTLRIVNAGKEHHAFEIEGTAVKTEHLTRGGDTQLEVDLKPGTYTVYCPVEGHRGKGMQRTVTVQ